MQLFHYSTTYQTGAETDLIATVFDLNGKAVQSVQITPNGAKGLNVSELNSGMYILRIAANDREVAVYRVVKK